MLDELPITTENAVVGEHDVACWVGTRLAGSIYKVVHLIINELASLLKYSMYAANKSLVATSVASAPGKVLMTGGYLILERPNAGIVLSTNARFYAIVKPIHEDVKPESWAWLNHNCCSCNPLCNGCNGDQMRCNGRNIASWTDVKLTSPQLSRESMYKLSRKHLTLQCVSSRQVTSYD
ncbi:hypothetical protein Gotur_012450 [Gossypium turneri]